MSVPKPAAIKPLGSVDKFVRMALVASSGFGKTVFSGTARQGLFLTTDPEGTISAWAMGSRCEEWQITSWEKEDGLTDAYRYLRDGGCENHDWVILDNVTEAQSMAMGATMEQARAINAKLDKYISSQQDYLRSQNMLVDMVKKFIDLPVNLIFTAHRTEQEDSEGEIYYGAAIHGQKGAIAQQILGYMNITGFGEVIEKDDEEVRRIWFTHHGPHRGKDRFITLGKAKDGLDVPTLEKYIERAKIRNKAARQEAKAKATGTTRRPAAKKTTVAKKAAATRRRASA